jgi:hypothetical protein
LFHLLELGFALAFAVELAFNIFGLLAPFNVFGLGLGLKL